MKKKTKTKKRKLKTFEEGVRYYKEAMRKFQPIKRGALIAMAKDSGVKGRVIGYTVQNVHGHPQVFYVVRLLENLEPVHLPREIAFNLVLVHPDNLVCVGDQKRKEKEEAQMDGVFEIGQTDGSWKVKTNAPQHQLDLLRWQIERKGKLTPRKFVRRLKRLGWRAKLVEVENENAQGDLSTDSAQAGM